MRRVLASAAVLLALTGTALAWPAGAGAHGFTIGLTDSVYENPTGANAWFSRTVAAGARLVLLSANWPSIAPQPPARGSDPTNPANPAYHWGTLDQAVRDAVAHGLTVAFTVASAGGPAWADGRRRPASVPPGTWSPNARAFGNFARALARRYSGTYKPAGALRPLSAGPLPRVRYYQGWGEPNLDDHLNPQWKRVHGHWKPASPAIYRRLLNAFYRGVKSVHSSNVVITAGTAPYGDSPGGGRMAPALFVRQLLCLNGHLKPQHCRDPSHFDVLAHHPYAIFGPYWHALNADDVSLPDMGKLTRPLHAAERDGLALPRGSKSVWVTEFSWDTKPPDPGGVPVIKRAYWIEETFHELWKEGVSAITWYLIADQPPVPSYPATYQSGLYFLHGRVKPGLEGFRFPFLVVRSRGRSVLWGISPRSGTVLVQRQAGGGWRTIYRRHVSAGGIFTRPVSLSRGAHLRAVIGPEHSLTWPRP